MNKTDSTLELKSTLCFRIGDTYCTTPTLSIDTVNQLPSDLIHIPGTKPWLLGAAKFGRTLLPYVHLARVFNIQPFNQSTTLSGPVIVVSSIDEKELVGLYVDQIIGFFAVSDFHEVHEPKTNFPIGLGSCLSSVIANNDREWGLIDLQALIANQQIQNLELS